MTDYEPDIHESWQPLPQGRKAIIRSTDVHEDIGRVHTYLPANYGVRVINADTLEVYGVDVAGWTLDEYVIPRLASGLIFAEEVT